MKLTIKTENLFNLSMSIECTAIAENVYMRSICDTDNIDEGFDNLIDALNDELIYTADQWRVMQEYQTPAEANFNEAWMMFYEDIAAHYYEIVTIEEA